VCERWHGLALWLALGAAPALAGEALDDPTRPSHLPAPAVAGTTATPGWRVDSIIVSPARRLAVINGRSVGVGERVGGARVLEILPYEVRLEYNGEVRHISLVPTRVKRPATER